MSPWQPQEKAVLPWGRAAAAMGDDFKTVPCLSWHHTVHVPHPPLSLWLPTLEAAAGYLDCNF
jgi:hypothetical protein